MDNIVFKKAENPLPDGYIGMLDNGKELEYCEAASFVLTWAFDNENDHPIAEFIHFRSVNNEVLDYVVTPGGKVTNGASVWRNLKALLSGEQELSYWDSTSIFKSILRKTI